jgi:murein L,D-transpeptidase YafK
MRSPISAGALKAAGLALAVAGTAWVSDALAISIELKDVAPDRIERQRAANDGRLPLANTPDTSRLDERLKNAGVTRGSPVMLRIFKETSELELWIEKGDTYVLFATYPICHWSGTLGPKLREGDKQTPEGFYTVTRRQLYHLGRWPRSINLGFPNTFDRAQKRNGSYILMHGGCSSVGCFAMTNPVIGEVYGLVQSAVSNGQLYMPVHVFPFRMTDDNMSRHGKAQWAEFWTDLKRGYQSFERTRRPPRISVCKGQYLVEDAPPKAAEEPVAQGKGRKKDRSDLMLGALRDGCPQPQMTTAENKAGAAEPVQNTAATAQPASAPQ